MSRHEGRKGTHLHIIRKIAILDGESSNWVHLEEEHVGPAWRAARRPGHPMGHEQGGKWVEVNSERELGRDHAVSFN